MYNTDYEKKTAEMLTGKTIKEIDVDGDGIYLKTTDGIVLAYASSDGGYSSWEIGSEDEIEEEENEN